MSRAYSLADQSVATNRRLLNVIVVALSWS